MSVPFQVKALHEYKSDYDDDLQFAAGQVITVTEIEDDDWYSGTYGNQSGLFPRNFVEIIKTPPASATAAKSAPPPPPPSSSSAVPSVVPDAEKTPSQKVPVAVSKPPELPKESPIEVPAIDSGVKADPEITQHDLEIDDLIRKNSTALPEPLDEEESVFEGNMKHVEESESEPSISVPKSVEEETPKQASATIAQKEQEKPPVPGTLANSSTGTKASDVPVPRVPMPGSLPSQRDDPYAIKKQFIGAGKSSYVPQVTPRDNSNVAHGFNDVAESQEVVRESDETPQTESNEPKMSLKERIAMLQKRQQEEAEREAAALKKKEERKRKLEEEKKLKASQTAAAPGSVDSATHAELESSDLSPQGVSTSQNHAVPPQKSGTNSSLNSGTARKDVSVSEDKASDLDAEGDGDNEESEAAVEDVEESKDVEDQDDDQEGEDDDEEEDDEDLRRKRLVERMAKISGGRNMFGMMGMPSPFGNTPAPASKPKSKKQAREIPPTPAPEVPSDEPDETISPVEKAFRVGIPIPGIVPQVTHKEEEESHEVPQSKHVPLSSVSPDNEDETTEGVTANEIDETTVEPEEPIKSEKLDESVTRGVEHSQVPANQPPARSKTDEVVTHQPHNMNIVEDNAQEASFAGYEADADISDRGVLSEKDNVISHSHPESSTNIRGSGIADPPIPKAAPPPTDVRTLNTNPEESSAPPLPPIAPVPPVPPAPSAPSAPSAPPAPPAPSAPSAPSAPNSDPIESDIHPPVPLEEAPLSPSFKGSSVGNFPSHAPPPIPTQDAPSLNDVTSKSGLESSKLYSPRVPVEVSDEPVPIASKRPPPPIPSDPPLPPSPQAKNTNFVKDESDESSEDEIQVVDSQPNVQAKKSQTYSHTETTRTPELTPSHPLRKSATGSLKRDTIESPRKSGELRRSGSFKEGRLSEQDQASLYVNAIEAELADLAQTSGWWIKSDIPDSLASKLGVDLEYEVDENRLAKRDGREVIYKDYYVLLHDLSQIVFEIQYQSDDPRDTVNVGSFKLKGSPKIRKDILHGFSSSLGQVLADFAARCIGSKLNTSLVEEAFIQLKSDNSNVLSPIGEKAFGAVVYKNVNNNVTRIDDIRSGDILCMKSAKFHSHKGLAGIGSKSISVGDGDEIYTGVILEYDPKKDKVKVAESGKGGIVKKESYKFGELKAGRIRIYRVISRDSVGW